MFVSSKDDQLLLVTQEDHAVLSGELAAHWGNDIFEPVQPHESMLTAARQHDVGWLEPDSVPLLDHTTGKPVHVTDVDLTAHQRFYAKGVAEVSAFDPYAGLVVSLHWTGLYRGRWGLGPSFDPARARAANLDRVVEDQEISWIKVREELRQRAEDGRRSHFEQRLWANYDLLQAFDLISIFLCTSFGGEEQTIPAVPRGPWQPSEAIVLRADTDRTVTVRPFPFDQPGLAVGVRGRWIADRRYATESELHETFVAAEPVQIEWRLEP